MLRWLALPGCVRDVMLFIERSDSSPFAFPSVLFSPTLSSLPPSALKGLISSLSDPMLSPSHAELSKAQVLKETDRDRGLP